MTYPYPPQQQPYPGYPGGPSKKSPAGLLIALGAVAAVLLVAFAAVGGYLLLKDDADSGDTKASSRGNKPSKSTEEPSKEPEGEQVSPTGSPYAFPVPVGFREVPAPKSDYITGSPQFESAVGAVGVVDEREVIIVSAWDVSPRNTSNFSAREAETYMDRSAEGLKQPTTGRMLRVDGSHAKRYNFRYGELKQINYFILHEEFFIQIRCQSVVEQDRISDACGQVVDGMELG